MQIDLRPYQAHISYPELRHVKPDKVLAQTLLQGYSGERSELTTVLQYAYHSLRCEERIKEVSKTLRGIFYVETLHMEFLGNCVRRLGGNVEYVLTLGEKRIGWQSDMINYMRTPAQMLVEDIKGEKYAAAFYEDVSASTRQSDIAALLAQLAEDERLHIRILSKLYDRYF